LHVLRLKYGGVSHTIEGGVADLCKVVIFLSRTEVEVFASSHAHPDAHKSFLNVFLFYIIMSDEKVTPRKVKFNSICLLRKLEPQCGPTFNVLGGGGVMY
jgi:hypothetical protein